jgi:hypothetical protein
MTFFMRSSAVLLAAALWHSLAQTQTRPAAGRIEGVVLQSGGVNPQPIVGARITVTKANSATGSNLLIPGRTQGTSLTDFGNTNLPGLPPPGQRGAPPGPPPIPQPTALPIPPVLSDRDGKFVVPNLEEGSYRLLITLNGYVRQEYGQRVFPGQGTLINLAAGEVLKDIAIYLTPTGNISGRLFDNEGQPAVAVPLQLLKAIYNQAGQRIFQNAGQARTNDRGEYRFYWVTPGRYYVVAGNSAANFTFGGSTAVPMNRERPMPLRTTPVRMISAAPRLLRFGRVATSSWTSLPRGSSSIRSAARSSIRIP